MEYVKLGNTGMDVSRICLGCMSFGIGERGLFPWALDEERSRPMGTECLYWCWKTAGSKLPYDGTRAFRFL